MSKGTLSEDCKLDFDENNDLEKTVMHGFRTNNALYTTSLSFTMYILLLNPFNEIVIISRTKHKDSKIQNIKK